MQTIDHDPNEHRPSKGETIFVTVGTVVTLTLMGIGLRWFANTYGTVPIVILCALIVAGCLALAFRLEAMKRRNRG